jgi:hypothetical protein
MTSSATSAPGTGTRSRSLVELAALLVGATFLLVGILGFLPGITTDYDSLGGAGTESTAKLLGIFQVSVLHNVVHLLFGIAGLALARTAAGARTFLVGGGVIYLVLWVYGLVIDKASNANFVPFNTADNWLHFVLGLAMVGLGVALAKDNRA